MADTFTKTKEPEGVGDDWKDVDVAKEHQPIAVTSNLNYREMEKRLADLTTEISRLTSEKTAWTAEMLKVKTAVEA